LWKRALGISWPGISISIANVLTILTIACGLFLFGYRLFSSGARQLSHFSDYFLIVLLLVPFISGFMAVHPRFNPLSYNAIMLIHILSSELIFVLIPCTKLAHCILFVFDRISSDIYWKMPRGAGKMVAYELHGKEAKV
jgi:nitrate reductase gamma subunit